MLVSDTGCCAQKTMKRSSAFNAKLVEELVKNADSLDHVTLMDADGTDPLSGHYTSNYTREYTRTASLALNDLLSIFEQAGLKGIGRVYLARMMDRLIVATMLYASTRNDISKNMDLVEALLHPETC